jgi:hypothetical protein
MSARTVTIEVAQETAELLIAKATARRLSLNQYLHTVATGGESAYEASPALSPLERAQRWDEWTTRHSVRAQSPADDSRDSIYVPEDEAL